MKDDKTRCMTKTYAFGFVSRDDSDQTRYLPSVIESRREKTGLRGFPTRSDTNRAVQPHKMARGSKFRI